MHATPSKPSSAWSVFCAEPYRLLFPIGLFQGLAGAWHWIAFHAGLTTDYGMQRHGLLQIAGFAGCFAGGFLLTALPNFLAVPVAKLWELLLFVALAAGTAAALLLSEVRFGMYLFLAFMVSLLIFTARRYAVRQGEPPPFVLMATGMILGTLGIALSLFPVPHFPRLGENLLQQGMLLAYVMGIGSFLGARFMGTFQPPAFLFRQTPGRPPVPPPVRMKRFFLAGGLLLFASFPIEAALSPLAGQLLRAAVVSAQLFLFANIHKTPKPPFVSSHLLRASLWLVVVGLWLVALLPGAYYFAALHVLFIGGFGLMMLIIGLRVTASHGGIPGLWEGARRSLTALGAGVAVTVFLRGLAPLLPSRFTLMLAFAAGLWCLLLLTWAVALVPRMSPRWKS
jgi:uncharacterized protein involved in response to NO